MPITLKPYRLFTATGFHQTLRFLSRVCAGFVYTFLCFFLHLHLCFYEMQPPPGVWDLQKKLEMTSDPSTSSEQAVFIDERSRPRTFSCTERIGYCILGANTRAQLPLRLRHRSPRRQKPRVIKIYSLESKNKFCLVPRSSSFGLPFCCSLLLTVARRWRQCL